MQPQLRHLPAATSTRRKDRILRISYLVATSEAPPRSIANISSRLSHSNPFLFGGSRVSGSRAFHITIGSGSAVDEPEHPDSYSDEGDSSTDGVPLSPPSREGSNEYTDSFGSEGYVHVDGDEDDIDPSESASRPRTSHQFRPGHEPRPGPTHRSSSQRRPGRAEHTNYIPRIPRPPPAPESVDPAEDYPGYARGHGPPHGRPYPQQYVRVAEPPAAPGYPPSVASGPSYNQYPANSVVPAGGNQLVHYGAQGPAYGGYPPHPYGPPQPAGSPGYFGPGPAPGGGQMGHPLAGRPQAGYPGQPPYTGQEMMPYGQGSQYYFNPQGYGMQMGSPIIYSYTPPPTSHSPSNDAAREDIARLERLILDGRREDEERAAAARRAAADKEAAEKKAAEEAAAAAKKAEEEEAAKKAADAAAAAAAAEAATPPPPPPEEKKKPIKFKDAINRKFSFPFHLCQKWEGMEALIKQAFMHVDLIGSHVIEGHYDLIGPDGEIILPQVWETMIEPDWSITMKMWPIPEPPPPPPDPPPETEEEQQVVVIEPGAPPTVVRSPPPGEAAAAGPTGVPPPPPPVPGPPGGPGIPANVTIVDPGAAPAPPKKTTTQPAPLPSFLKWTAGGNRARASKKAAAKPENSVQHDVVCRVM
ncbi:MAG: hypothetical protein M1837_006815 [Sclerophora amabilis]|nr:MAG: hypothetical protein M1837_006815 [Sclerophora amabilis]